MVLACRGEKQHSAVVGVEAGLLAQPLQSCTFCCSPSAELGQGQYHSPASSQPWGRKSWGRLRVLPFLGSLPHAAPGQGGQKHKHSPAPQSSADPVNR